MEKDKRTFNEDETTKHNLSRVIPTNPWHSTPVRKHRLSSTVELSPGPAPLAVGSEAVRQAASVIRLCPDDSLSPVCTGQQGQATLCELGNSMVLKQRHELKLLMTELKDRDQELNDMVAAHQKQLRAWEEDRQRVLQLEQKCSSLDGELQKCNTIIQALTKRVHIMEARQQDRQRALETSQQEVHHLGQHQQHLAKECEELQERNQTLNSTVLKLSSQVGQLQVREEELKVMLKLKDSDMTGATNHILELTNRFHKLEAELGDYCSREAKALKEAEEHKHCQREAKNEIIQLRDELQEKSTEINAQREELTQLRQENEVLRNELSLLGEEQCRKEELLELARSKKERTECELHSLRQICENQQNELQLLQLNLEYAQEALKPQEHVELSERDSIGSAAFQTESDSEYRTLENEGAAPSLSQSCTSALQLGSHKSKGEPESSPAAENPVKCMEQPTAIFSPISTYDKAGQEGSSPSPNRALSQCQALCLIEGLGNSQVDSVIDPQSDTAISEESTDCVLLGHRAKVETHVQEQSQDDIKPSWDKGLEAHRQDCKNKMCLPLHEGDQNVSGKGPRPSASEGHGSNDFKPLKEQVPTEKCACKKRTDATAELAALGVDAGQGMEWLAVFSGLGDTEQSLLVVDFGPDTAKDPQCSCPADMKFSDLSCLNLSKNTLVNVAKQGTKVNPWHTSRPAQPVDSNHQTIHLGPPNSENEPCHEVLSSSTNHMQLSLSESQIIVSSLDCKNWHHTSPRLNTTCNSNHSQSSRSNGSGQTYETSASNEHSFVNGTEAAVFKHTAELKDNAPPSPKQRSARSSLQDMKRQDGCVCVGLLSSSTDH